MADIVARDTHAGSVRRAYQFATHVDFPTRLMRSVLTRADFLHREWNNFQQAHVRVLQNLAEDELPDQHVQLLTEIEELFLEADEIMQERIAQVNQGGPPQIELDHVDQYQPGGPAHDNHNEHGSEHGDEAPVQEGNGNDNAPEQVHIPDPDLIVHDQNQYPPEQNVLPPNVEPLAIQPPQVGLAGQPNAGGAPNVQVVQYPTMNANMQVPWQFRIENIWGEFHGDKKQWPTFHDSFKAAIYDDPHIRPVRKFQILQAALKGRAAAALGRWTVCDASFEPAWIRLNELYNDPYGTSRELFQELNSLPKMDSPNGLKLQKISNAALGVARELEALGLPAAQYDMMFIHAAQSKLDQKTSIDWDTFRGANNRPTLKQFTGFLDTQARALCNAYQVEHTSTDNKQKERKRPFNNTRYQGGNKRFKSNAPSTSTAHNNPVKTENKGCAVCFQDHLTRKCDQFLKMSVTKRKQKAVEAHLCFNCLGRGHSLRDCKAGPCNRCETKHNSLLCLENPSNRNVNVAQVKPKGKNRFNKKSSHKKQ